MTARSCPLLDLQAARALARRSASGEPERLSPRANRHRRPSSAPASCSDPPTAIVPQPAPRRPTSHRPRTPRGEQSATVAAGLAGAVTPDARAPSSPRAPHLPTNSCDGERRSAVRPRLARRNCGSRPPACQTADEVGVAIPVALSGSLSADERLGAPSPTEQALPSCHRGLGVVRREARCPRSARAPLPCPHLRETCPFRATHVVERPQRYRPLESRPAVSRSRPGRNPPRAKALGAKGEDAASTNRSAKRAAPRSWCGGERPGTGRPQAPPAKCTRPPRRLSGPPRGGEPRRSVGALISRAGAACDL